STPGSAISTSEAWVFGAAPNVVAAPEKIFERVESWACVSRPMTASQLIGPPRLRPRWTTRPLRCPQMRGRNARLGAARRRSSRRNLQRETDGLALVPVGRLLIAVRDIEDHAFRKIVALDLQADGKPFPVEAAGDRDRGCAGQIAGDGENIVQIHL